MATAGATPGRAGARTGAGGGAGQGRRRRCVPLRSASTGSSRRGTVVHAAVHPRTRERRLGREDGAGRNGFRAR